MDERIVKQIELVEDDHGRIRRCWVLDEDGNRVKELAVSAVTETVSADGGPRQVSITVIAVRVKRTPYGVDSI